MRNEVALAKAELAESSTRAKSGLVALIGAVSTLLAGSLAVTAAIILGLAKVMEPWLAALIVGVLISVVGLFLLRGARKKLVPPHLEIDRTRTAVRQDVEVLARRRLMNASSEHPGDAPAPTAIRSNWSARRIASAPISTARSTRWNASCQPSQLLDRSLAYLREHGGEMAYAVGDRYDAIPCRSC